MKTYKKPTKNSATLTLKRLYTPYPEEDSLTIEKMYIAAGRDTSVELEDKNRNWLSNKLTALYYHNLAKPIYSYDGRRKLERVQLTVEGKRALGRVSAPGQVEPASLPSVASLTLEDMLAAVEALRKKYPGFDIDLTIKPKEQPIS